MKMFVFHKRTEQFDIETVSDWGMGVNFWVPITKFETYDQNCFRVMISNYGILEILY